MSLCLVLATGCSDRTSYDSGHVPSNARGNLYPGTFTVFSYHLDEAATKHKLPRDVLTTMTEEVPDVLAIQGAGDVEGLADFQATLRSEGLAYPHQRFLRVGTANRGLAVLSKHPIVLHNMRTNDTYRIRGTLCKVQRGFLDVSMVIDSTFLLRLFVADLVGKEYHPLGQAEMRRNEARLLAQHVRRALKDQPDQHILVACSLGDIRGSSAFRHLTSNKNNSTLLCLAPKDAQGNGWTFYAGDDDGYVIHDFLFVSHALEQRVDHAMTRIVDEVGMNTNSSYRPLLTRIRHKEAPPD